MDPAQYDAYAGARGELALPAGALLPVESRQAQFGFHPSLTEVQRLYGAGAVAVLANVGIPNRPGKQRPHAYDELSFAKGGYAIPAWAAAQAGAGVTSDAVLTFDSGVSLLPLGGRGPGDRAELKRAAESVALRTEFPPSGIGRELNHVAKLIPAGRSMGIHSQVFLVTLGGFDTHISQLPRQAELLGQLDGALGAFYRATLELGVATSVTTYTASEFGRSLTPNGSHGTDHGWGNHQLVVGAAVQGGQIHGRFPDMRARAERDSTGAWIPTTNRERYHRTMMEWLNGSVSSESLGFVA